jgi:hypothetical protein
VRRTAVAIRPGARIITPSMTACPPTCSGLLGSNFISCLFFAKQLSFNISMVEIRNHNIETLIVSGFEF